jgi:hypothetical protein
MRVDCHFVKTRTSTVPIVTLDSPACSRNVLCRTVVIATDDSNAQTCPLICVAGRRHPSLRHVPRPLNADTVVPSY